MKNTDCNWQEGSNGEFVRRFDVYGHDKEHCFEQFLAHTDQKKKAVEWLLGAIDTLPEKKAFLDAGAGNGVLTQQLAGYFKRIEAIEPEDNLARYLRAALPECHIHACTIMEAVPDGLADFILCSHVFYHIPFDSWLSHTEKLISWLSPGGILVIALQAPDTDCMKLLRYFTNITYDLEILQEKIKFISGISISLERVPASIVSKEIKPVYCVAEFNLNLQYLENPPLKESVYHYIRDHFYREECSIFHLTCDQFFLKIHRSA